MIRDCAFLNRLEGKVALITGGAKGIGEVTARVFHQHGAKVVIADIEDDLGHLVCKDFGKNAASYVHCDVSKEVDVKNAVDATVAKFGKLDIMFNNAGIVDPWKSNITNNDEADFEKVLGVNVKGVFLGTKHAARVMVPVKRGSIINNGSISSVIGGIASHAYVASKHAVLGLTKNAAAELGQYGIRVNCISSFVLASSLTTNFISKDDNEIESWARRLANLKGVVLTAEDLALAALYLGSDESGYVSGHNFVLDGGFSIVNPSFGLFKQNP
ncbi:Short-chain dehydrogenase/reductase SDR [Cinnamomum micranthum f. kanehirae]|uniref:Short-chain dehydrogenase/reductase SDR n=1 Tax=Cinnamomum micranthum f. kanehirae TaxID=337451 RepID=A0A3S3MSD4_9MAGN|nr:Short-chain dehydrogenase/reductase SDR [Cinnamomum micranthum f. kanehirae]